MDRRTLLRAAGAWLLAPSLRAAETAAIVVLRTGLGEIEIEVEAVRAPATSANFLRYVDGGRYDGGRFHRTVRLDNQPGQTVLIGQALTPPVPILSACRARPRP